MSRFIKKAGQSSAATYTDADVCALLPQYTGTLSAGTLSASDSTNVCNTRGGWERVYYEPEYTGSGTTICVEVDSSSYDAFCFQLYGFKTTAGCTQLRAGIRSGTCFCTCNTSAESQAFNNGGCICGCCSCSGNLTGACGVMVCGGFSYGALYTNGCSGTLYQLHINSSTGCANHCSRYQYPVMGGSTVTWPALTMLKMYSNCTWCASNGVIQILGLKRGSSDIGGA